MLESNFVKDVFWIYTLVSVMNIYLTMTYTFHGRA